MTLVWILKNCLIHVLIRIGHVLMSWLETYPGDFVHPSTLTTLKAFNSLMISVTWLLHYAMEIIPIIKMLGRMTDEDVGWALPDTTDESAIKSVLECLHNLERSLAPPSSSALRGSVADNPNEELVPPTTPLTTGKSIDGSMTYPPSDTSPHHETFASTFTSNDHLASTAASSPVHSFSPHDRPAKWTEEHRANDILHHPLASLDPSEHFIASTLPLKSTLTTSSFSLPDNKVELKALLDASLFLLSIPEEAIALQITRLEWNIFSHMKPRHLIRYVLAPRDPNNPRKALRDPNSPIAKSTDYLNYLAVWASSMILIHDKLKSRARVLLKLMKVAYELRDMDDFHSLVSTRMGVLAGIEAQPVYRLDATFEIVQHMDLQSYRRYLSLKKLMSSQRSFSAYRLARQTASSQCVPYLGTYLQDITAVNEVKDDMKDGKVNLTKMVQIAKSASSVLNCNLLAPKIVFDPKISNLIMKVPVLSEDAQYELSYKYKPRLPTSNHHHSTTPIVNGSNGGSHSGMGGLMSAITAAAAATTGVGSGSGSIGVHGGRQSASGCETGKLSSSVSSGSLLAPFPLDPAPLLLQSCTSAPPSSDSRPHPPSPPPPPPPHPNPNPPLLPPTAPTPSSSLATSLPIGVLSTPSLVAKKGTRKLKHFLSTAISSSSSHSSHPPSNSNGHHHLSLPHH
ncbi:hypothetical protein VP01_1348g5 [Puccinia sorghi]|uniref:Ras-GEF domain-containing protein n=1 Tax=Puccinia sorghi TaxID=27349 RepID=A0A0L6VMS8_9BASI|nr:hypothetical protein VP01_1348g5 [Puccinia sorghi]